MTFKNWRWAIVTDTSVVRAGDVPPSEMVTKALAELPAGDGAVPAVEQIPVEVGTLADQGTPIKGKLQLID
ncbi:MAG: hypothetical protein J7559_01350, partial [Cohnella sp.]|nr:hypothetical protein [Cohnella sp.]